MKRQVRWWWFLVVLGVMFESVARGQCGPRWLPGSGVPGLAGNYNSQAGAARAGVMWDPDGHGPLPERFVVAGVFSVAGSVIANSMAAWDGQSWSRMVAPPGVIFDMVVIGSDLYASGLSGVFHWNGSGWTTVLATGGDGSTVVGAMGVMNGDLVISRINEGGFNWTSVVLLRHNGVWSQLGGTFDNSVSSLSVVNGVLTATGYFTSVGGQQAVFIAQWDGSRWNPLPISLHSTQYDDNVVDVACEYQGGILVGGGFSITGSDATELALWDGAAWHAYAAPDPYTLDRTWTLLPKNGRVYAGGYYGGFGYVAGDTYTRVGSFDLTVISLADMGESVVALGGFHSTGNTPADCIAAFDGSAWSSFGAGTNNTINRLAVAGGRVIAAGAFLTIDGVPTSHIAAFDGRAWQALGTSYTYLGANAVGAFNDDPVIFGYTDPNDYGPHVARWDGAAWRAMGTTQWAGAPSVFTMFRGELIAAGSMSYADNHLVHNIARWDGSSWQPLGLGTNGAITALVECNGDLMVGGSFTSAGGVAATGVARWNGTTWSALGSGCPGLTSALCLAVRNNNQLMVGGQFNDGGSSSMNHLARWDGTTWARIVADNDSWITSMVVLRNDLYVVWYGGATVSRWDGASWSTVADSPFESTGLLPFGHELFVSHYGVNAGNNVSAYYSRWSPDGAPWIAGQPSAQQAPCGGSVSFSVAPASAYPNLQYSWLRNGEPIHDGQRPGGSSISGSTTASVTISGVSDADVGSYAAMVFNTCGADTSAPVTLTLTICCSDPDFDHDGSPGTDRDIAAFFACLAGSCCDTCGSVDFNGDGDVGTDQDIDSFFRVLSGGSC